ncbi:VOC family protein [Thioalkalivibrio sp. HK1]|uniref:VOC family protein n=1 Tax=Thioalkalivibrio sp. HK1 TaxID=1469245 RepID=UPI00056FF41A|nr:VOC family protein [Thioalkalivibrio sp. HK1]
MNDKTDTEEKPLVRIEGLDHIVLRCARLEATMAFYIDVLGCTLERSVLESDLWQLRAGGSLIDLVPVGSALAGPKAPDPDRANIAHFCLRIDRPNWEDLEAGLASQGIALIGPPAIRYGAQGFGRSVYLADPEGNIVELKANRTSLDDEDQG